MEGEVVSKPQSSSLIGRLTSQITPSISHELELETGVDFDALRFSISHNLFFSIHNFHLLTGLQLNQDGTCINLGCRVGGVKIEFPFYFLDQTYDETERSKKSFKHAFIIGASYVFARFAI